MASGAEASGSQPDSADGFLGTKGQQGAVYQAVLAASVAGGAVLTLLPGACASALMFGASVQPAASAAATSALLGGCGGSLWLAAACAATLKEAARHDRLGSDTYKRLNLALAALAVNVLAVLLLTGLEVAKPAAAG